MAASHADLTNSEERFNFFRLTLLLFRLGNTKLREYLKSHWSGVCCKAWPGSAPTPWSDTPPDAATLKKIGKGKLKFKFKKQENKFDSGNTNDWDFSLLSLVLLNDHLGFTAKSSPEKDALEVMQNIRNTLICHAPDASITTTVFNTEWTKACNALMKFNATQEEVDAIREDAKQPVETLIPMLKECVKLEEKILAGIIDLEKNSKERHEKLIETIDDKHDEVISTIKEESAKIINTIEESSQPKNPKIMRLQMNKDHQKLLQEYLPKFQNDFKATELLEYLPCLTEEQKNDIAYDDKNHLPSKAVTTLVEKLKEHDDGFGQFIGALRKADLSAIAVLLTGDPYDEETDENEKEADKESNYVTYKNSAVVDVRVRMHILQCTEDSEEKQRQLDLEKKIATLSARTNCSTEYSELRSAVGKELPKGVFFVRIKKTDDRDGGVRLVFRVVKTEHLEELWKFYQQNSLADLLKRNLVSKLKEHGGDLDLKLTFQKKDYEAILRIFKNRENKTLEESGDETASKTFVEDIVSADQVMETEVQNEVLHKEVMEIFSRPVYLDDDDNYNLSRELKLRDYQKELAAPALKGKNTIICAPTNSGKTYVAMEIAKRHLDANKDSKEEGKEPRVVFIVDKQSLVLQQKDRFEEYLTNYSTSDITGATEAQRAPLEILLKHNDIVVLTAQILVNALTAKKVSITDMSLLVFDECHHANKDHPYMQLMQEYLHVKVNGNGSNSLPQVIGLTASLGVGKSSTVEKAKEHVLRMCANLDASNINTVRKNIDELKEITGDNVNECKSVPVNKKADIFEQEINKNMGDIENFLKSDSSFKPPETKNRTVESYRQWIEELETCATTKNNNDHFICAQLLRRYHEALLINENVRMKDALQRLNKYFNKLNISKFTKTESWLQDVFLKTKEKIEKNMQDEEENPLLKKLQELIKGFHDKAPEEGRAMGILFIRTRDYAFALKKWMEENETLKTILRPEVLVGSAEFTQSQQESVIKRFKSGDINIIIATTVAEEGLDIPQCSYVICYGVKGNEISFVQSRGRIRAKEGNYVHLSEAKSRGAEHVHRNAYREMLMALAVAEAQKIHKEDFLKKINNFQTITVRSRLRKQEQEKKKKSQLQTSADGVKFSCRKCNAFVCHTQDIRRFKDAHHVVVNRDIYQRIEINSHDKPNAFDGINFKKKINEAFWHCLEIGISFKIHCSACGFDWGVILEVEGTELPCLKVVSLVTTLNHGKTRKLYKKWKDLPIKICEASLEEIIDVDHQ